MSGKLESKSSLAKPIQSLINLIFDIDAMEAQMKEYEVSVEVFKITFKEFNYYKKNILTLFRLI